MTGSGCSPSKNFVIAICADVRRTWPNTRSLYRDTPHHGCIEYIPVCSIAIFVVAEWPRSSPDLSQLCIAVRHSAALQTEC